MEIRRGESRRTFPGRSIWFTGTVTMQPLIEALDPARVRAVEVTFQPGARTFWHTHPLGQTLIVTAGSGRVQREGGPVEAISPGDVVWFAPGETHWHGAAPDAAMTHIAVQEALDGETAAWLGPVSDSDYQAVPASPA